MGRSLIVIPAHLDSQRLPGKALLKHKGRSLLEWTYKRAMACQQFADVLVATPDPLVFETVLNFNGQCVFTPDVEFPNGTQRAFHAIEHVHNHWEMRHSSLIVWQVDEPCIDVDDVAALHRSSASIRTLIISKGSMTSQALENLNTVKAIVNEDDNVQWFTRLPVPYAYAHVGIYAFTLPTVLQLKNKLVHEWATHDKLEQLTWLAHGGFIKAIGSCHELPPLSVNVASDWQAFCAHLDGWYP